MLLMRPAIFSDVVGRDAERQPLEMIGRSSSRGPARRQKRAPSWRRRSEVRALWETCRRSSRSFSRLPTRSSTCGPSFRPLAARLSTGAPACHQRAVCSTEISVMPRVARPAAVMPRLTLCDRAGNLGHHHRRLQVCAFESREAARWLEARWRSQRDRGSGDANRLRNDRRHL